ncbi:hypothetical protein [Microcoleus sp. S11D4]
MTIIIILLIRRKKEEGRRKKEEGLSYRCYSRNNTYTSSFSATRSVFYV